MSVGSITLLTGPMFAGKTTQLLARHALAAHDTRGCVLVRHVLDTRTDRAPMPPAVRAAQLADVDAAGAPHVFVDEGQFFPDLAAQCVRWRDAGAHVVVAALDRMHTGAWFATTYTLAHTPGVEVRALAGRCATPDCAGASRYTQRTAAASCPVLVGGAEAYRPLCAACFARAPP